MRLTLGEVVPEFSYAIRKIFWRHFLFPLLGIVETTLIFIDQKLKHHYPETY